MKARRHSARVGEGRRVEGQVLKALRRRGVAAQLARWGESYDMTAPGGRRIEVKGVVETTTRGSDGYPIRAYVASNIHPETTRATHYVVALMNADRSRIRDMYVLPASKVTGRTLSLTRKKLQELAPYRRRFDLLGAK